MWSPKNTQCLIAQGAGILLGIGGFFLILRGVTATGKINITTIIINGEIESGSAGLFLMFFSVFLIIIPIWFGKDIDKSYKRVQDNSDEDSGNIIIRKLLFLTILMVIITIILAISVSLFSDKYPVLSALCLFGAFCSGPITFYMVIGLIMGYLSDN